MRMANALTHTHTRCIKENNRPIKGNGLTRGRERRLPKKRAQRNGKLMSVLLCRVKMTFTKMS